MESKWRLFFISSCFSVAIYILIIGMFGNQFYMEPISSSKSLDSPFNSKQSSSFDLQYEICSRYMRMASQQLCKRQIELMENTNKFIQKMNDNLTLKDVSSTQQSLTLGSLLDEEDPFAQPTKSKLLLRKSQSNTSIRRTDFGLTQALRQVQKKCSQKTYSILSNLSNQYKKIKQKLGNNEKMEKQLKKLQTKFLTTEQQLFMIKKKSADLQSECKSHLQQNKILKKKLKEFDDQNRSKTTLTLSKSSDNLLNFAKSSTYDKLKKYLQEKQVHIFKKEKDVKIIQDKIQKSIEGVVDESSCDKCCQLVKRIKDSILKYRGYLQQQSNSGEALYSKYKQIFTS